MSLRNRIASDLHDEIGSTLSSISLYSEAAKKMLNGNEQADKVLTKINSNTSQMMEAMSDIVWAINTRNDKLDNLVNRMRAFAVQVSEAKKFDLHLAENKDLPDMPLDMYERKNIYLIFKEAVNNAAKYSECKNVWIDFSNKSHLLEMKITDDGTGFTVADASRLSKNKGGGNGLMNMKKRADDLKGELRIISEEGKGTEVILKMRLKK
jgi:signal transduction histidine kinase